MATFQYRNRGDICPKQIAKANKTTVRNLQRWNDRESKTGSLVNKRRTYAHRFKLSQIAIDMVCSILESDPAAFYDEVQWRVWARTGETASIRTFARMGKRLGFDDKVAETRSHHRDPVKMRLHAEQRSMYDSRAMIFVDEKHNRGRDLHRRRAKGRNGKKPLVPVSVHLARNWSWLAGMTSTGFIDCDIVELGVGAMPNAVDRERFWVMFRRCIWPHLQPFIDDGVLRPCSIVVIDNCSLHHDDKQMLKQLCENLPPLPNGQPQLGSAKLIYIPPFCPIVSRSLCSNVPARALTLLACRQMLWSSASRRSSRTSSAIALGSMPTRSRPSVPR